VIDRPAKAHPGQDDRRRWKQSRRKTDPNRAARRRDHRYDR
jgi:hypothetical protein